MVISSNDENGHTLKLTASHELVRAKNGCLPNMAARQYCLSSKCVCHPKLAARKNWLPAKSTYQPRIFIWLLWRSDTKLACSGFQLLGFYAYLRLIYILHSHLALKLKCFSKLIRLHQAIPSFCPFFPRLYLISPYPRLDPRLHSSLHQIMNKP